VLINNGATGTLTWDTKDSGPTLLNITVPAAPTIVTAGVYAVQAEVSPTGNMTAQGQFTLSLSLSGAAGGGASVVATATDLIPTGQALVIATCAAGDAIAFTLHNLDGVQNLHFEISGATVTRLS
jgi:hypothetical protein